MILGAMAAELKTFRRQLAFTMTLVLVEAVGWMLFPLIIGRAIDDVLEGTRRGLWELAGLGTATVGIYVARRVCDSRAYAKVYVRLSEELVARQAAVTVSAKTARLGMLREVVEFFENSLPTLVNSVFGIAGTALILWTLNLSIFLGCISVGMVAAVLYGFTGKFTTRCNEAFNNEYEKRVEAVESGVPRRVGRHVRRMMRWNIKLSDLEAANFGVVWVFMVALLVFSVNAAVENTDEYGKVFAIVMYVFQFMESVAMLPLYYQEWLRLREITGRLRDGGSA